MPDPLALYGAAAATFSVGWQVFRERRRLRTHVRIEFEHGSAFLAGSEVLEPRRENRPREYVLTVVIINKGETTEYVSDVLIEPTNDDGFGIALGRGPQGDALLAPRGRFTCEFPLTQFAHDRNLADGFVAKVRLASGVNLMTKRHELLPEVLQDVGEHNARLFG